MRRSWNFETLALLDAAFALVASYALFLSHPAEGYGKVGNAETILLDAWRPHLYLAVLVSGVAAVIVPLWTMRRQKRWTSWLLFVAWLASLLLCCSGTIGEIATHRVVASVRDRDGSEYRFLLSHFLQGSHLAICRLRGRVGRMEEHEVLVDSPWEGSYLTVVRPQEALKETELYLTEDRVLVGVPYENEAFLAYDLKTGEAYGLDEDLNEKSYVDVRRLSPFLLLKAGDVPKESDFQAVLHSKSRGRTFLEAVEKDLKNKNAKVRELARRLLPALRGGERPSRPLPTP